MSSVVSPLILVLQACKPKDPLVDAQFFMVSCTLWGRRRFNLLGKTSLNPLLGSTQGVVYTFGEERNIQMLSGFSGMVWEVRQNQKLLMLCCIQGACLIAEPVEEIIQAIVLGTDKNIARSQWEVQINKFCFLPPSRLVSFTANLPSALSILLSDTPLPPPVASVQGCRVTWWWFYSHLFFSFAELGR